MTTKDETDTFAGTENDLQVKELSKSEGASLRDEKYNETVSIVLGEKGRITGQELTSESKTYSRAKKELQTLKGIQFEEDFLKDEIVRSILDDILYNIEHPDKLSRGSSYYDGQPTLSKRGNSSMRLFQVSSIKLTSYDNHENKIKCPGRKKTLRISSIVKELEFPIALPRSKSIDSRPKFERLTLDTHVTTSSTIIKPARDSASTKSGDERSSELIDKTLVVDSPFKLSWCFGYNTEVPVINLSGEDSSELMFANSQYAVIYDFHENAMSFLQGHINILSCMSANPSGSILATADISSQVGTSRVIIWDRRPCVLGVLDNVHPYGCQQVGLSVNGEYLVTISAKQTPISIKIWEWERNLLEPTVSTTVGKESLGNVVKLSMNQNSKSEFLVTFERAVVFANVSWKTVIDGHEERRMIETVDECEFTKSTMIPPKLGTLTDSTYLNHYRAIALSSTCKGYVVVWENGINTRYKRIFRTYVRLHLHCITNIQVVDDKIAVATETGNVSFYDLDLKILFFHKLHQEALVSLSFNLAQEHRHSHAASCAKHASCANTWRREHGHLSDATLNGQPFSVRHYIVSTESGKIAYVNASCGTPKYLPIPGREIYTAIETMPNRKYLCAGTASGKCVLFDTEHRTVKVIRQLKVKAGECQAVSVLKYSSRGDILVCGMYTGDIWFVDPLVLSPTLDAPLEGNQCCVTHLEFSTTMDYLVVTDVSFCVSAYLLGDNPQLIGRLIGHYKHIVTLFVLPNDDNDTVIKIFTLSMDRSVCHFVIDRENKSLIFKFHQRVEQSTVPMYSVKYPFKLSATASYLGVNDDYKFRLHDAPSQYSTGTSVTRRVRGMFQGPDFGSPINFMQVFYTADDTRPYLLFKTNNHIGIHLLPIDGSAFRALGYRISPTDVIGCKMDSFGEFVFTISELSSGISMWKVNTKAVEDFAKSGGEGLEPFLRMLDKEKEQEIRDFFYLGQILHQGERPDLVRVLKNTIPICEVANALQALGCHLSRQDISELTHELVISDIENSSYNLDFEDFVKLYVNHRNNDEFSIHRMRKAFRDFYSRMNMDNKGLTSDFEPAFDFVSFIRNLAVSGQEMSLENLYSDFNALVAGHAGDPYDENMNLRLTPNIPKQISFKTFITDILGYEISDSVFIDY